MPILCTPYCVCYLYGVEISCQATAGLWSSVTSPDFSYTTTTLPFSLLSSLTAISSWLSLLDFSVDNQPWLPPSTLLPRSSRVPRQARYAAPLSPCPVYSSLIPISWQMLFLVFSLDPAYYPNIDSNRPSNGPEPADNHPAPNRREDPDLRRRRYHPLACSCLRALQRETIGDREAPRSQSRCRHLSCWSACREGNADGRGRLS